MTDAEVEAAVERGLALREQQPDWTPRQIVTAALHGQDSAEFRDATARADAFAARFAATGGWMTLP